MLQAASKSSRNVTTLYVYNIPLVLYSRFAGSNNSPISINLPLGAPSGGQWPISCGTALWRLEFGSSLDPGLHTITNIISLSCKEEPWLSYVHPLRFGCMLLTLWHFSGALYSETTLFPLSFSAFTLTFPTFPSFFPSTFNPNLPRYSSSYIFLYTTVDWHSSGLMTENRSKVRGLPHGSWGLASFSLTMFYLSNTFEHRTYKAVWFFLFFYQNFFFY